MVSLFVNSQIAKVSFKGTVYIYHLLMIIIDFRGFCYVYRDDNSWIPHETDT